MWFKYIIINDLKILPYIIYNIKMYSEDIYHPADPNDYELSPQEVMLQDSKSMDRGYTYVYRKVLNKKGELKNKKIDIYTTSGVGNFIRDAETGEYYNNKVGSKDEDLFFKVGLSTGECKSANGSNTLFYLSPQHYSNHLHVELNESIVSKWEEKRDLALKNLKNNEKKSSLVEVN